MVDLQTAQTPPHQNKDIDLADKVYIIYATTTKMYNLFPSSFLLLILMFLFFGPLVLIIATVVAQYIAFSSPSSFASSVSYSSAVMFTGITSGAQYLANVSHHQQGASRPLGSRLLQRSADPGFCVDGISWPAKRPAF